MSRCSSADPVRHRQPPVSIIDVIRLDRSVLTASAITLLGLTLLLPLVTGVFIYRQTRQRSFLQIPFAIVLWPLLVLTPLLLLVVFAEVPLPFWLYRMPAIFGTLIVIDAVRRLEGRPR